MLKLVGSLLSCVDMLYSRKLTLGQAPCVALTTIGESLMLRTPVRGQCLCSMVASPFGL